MLYNSMGEGKQLVPSSRTSMTATAGSPAAAACSASKRAESDDADRRFSEPTVAMVNGVL